jgi:hypothetical protein
MIVNVGTFYSLTVPITQIVGWTLRLFPNSRRPATGHRRSRSVGIVQ